jgi:bisphosphoglycerate-independent phosphoglycerate mutase (AlkP superfamily)
VPFIILNNDLKGKIVLESNGSLSNIAPTIIELMGLDIPPEMNSSSSLIIKN